MAENPGAGAPAPSSATVGGGANSSPGPAPSSAPSGGALPGSDSYSEPGHESGGVDFDTLFSSGGQETEPQPAPPAPEPAPVPQPPPAPGPGEAPPVQAPPTVPGQAPEVVASQGVQPPQPGAAKAQVDPGDPLSLAQYLSENEAVAINALAQTVFKLEQKDLEGLETDIAATIPLLLSKVAVFAQQQALTQMGRLLPEMMTRFGDMVQKHSANERQFYEAWPSIDRTKHGKMVTELGIRYRQMFPNATLDQMIEQLGPLAMSQLGLPLVQRARPGQASVAAVNAAAGGNGGRAPPPRGFVPAAPGGTARSVQPDSDPWSWMGQRE